MKIRLAFGSIFLLVLSGTAGAQSSQTARVIGEWRGSSLCLVKPSPCHDESVVYRIAPSNTPDSVSLDALKIVNGQEDDMGTLACRVASPGPQLTCRIPRGTWQFTVRGDSLTGELRLPDGTKFRDVRTARSQRR